MSAEAILGIITLTLTALGLIAAGAWWMSALYGKVDSIQTNTKDTSTKMDTLTEKMDHELHDVRKEQRELRLSVGDLQVRMVVVEGAIDTEEE